MAEAKALEHTCSIGVQSRAERSGVMRVLKLGILMGAIVSASSSFSARTISDSGQGPKLSSMGPLAFGPDGTIFAADNQAAAVFALDLGASAGGGAQGAKGLEAVDSKLAAML